MKLKINDVARNAIVAALYVVLTLATYPVSFGLYQLRAAEMLVLLCFFRRDYAIGLTIGCMVVNCFSFQVGIVDIFIGTFATLVSCLLVGFCKHLWVASLIPIVANGFIVGFELYYFLKIDFWTSVLFVSLGELGAMVLGYVTFVLLKNRKKFFKFIDANQNREFKC